jgi:iron(III) transport system permease protein
MQSNEASINNKAVKASSPLKKVKDVVFNKTTYQKIGQKLKDPNTYRRGFNKTKNFFSKPQNIILVLFALILTITVVVPLVQLFFNSFIVQGLSEARELNEAFSLSLKKGDWTVTQWGNLLNSPNVEGYSSSTFWTPLYRSVLMALISCCISVIFGGLLAWLVTRSNMPCKKFISTVFVFPYIMPSWSIAMFWENFFKNSQIASCNYQVGMLQAMTGICVPESLLYGFWPCALVLGIHYTPFAYILIGGILRNMDSNLEEAAVILKTSKFKILRRITLPIVAPALISTVLLVFASSISSYTVPAFLNKNNSFVSISLTMRSLLMNGRKGQGYVVAVILLAFSVLILTINNWFTSSRRSYTTVTGKSGQVAKTNLGKRAKWIIAVLAILLVSFFAIFPLISFVLESFEDIPGDLSSMTTKYWTTLEDLDGRITTQGYSSKGIFHNSTIWLAFGRSILVSTIVALLAGTSGILIGYAVSKNRHSKFANYVSSIAFLPYLIPAMSFGATFFAVSFTPGLTWLNVTTTGSEWSAVTICILVGSVKFLPFASRSGTNAMLQVSGEIEEAAVINGCPWWKRMTRIIFPIQKSSFISGYLLPFISCMRELTLFTLITSSFSLLTNVLQYYQVYGMDQLCNGINLIIVVFVILVNLLVNKVTGASIDKGIGG